MTTNNELIFEMVPEYAALGIYMFALYGVNEDDLSCACGTPNCPDAGKHPVGGRGVKDATLDLDLLRKWFLEDPAKEPNPRKRNRNLGGAMGAKSRKTALDIDVGEGKVGGETYAELIREKGEVPTLTQLTPTGGFHQLYNYNSALKTSSNTLGKHVDCRNDNGYVCLAPSLHRNGKRYEWMNWGTPCADLPAHLTKKKETRGRPRKDDLYKGKFTLEQVAEMLEHVPADDRDLWRAVGIILGREFKLAEEAWNLYINWSEKWEGRKGRGHDAIMHQAFYEISQQDSEQQLSIGTIIKAAQDHGWVPTDVQEMNKQYAVVWMGGDCVVLREHTNPDTGLLEVSFSSPAAVKAFNASNAKVGGVEGVERWLRYPKRRTYDDLVFRPGSTASDSRFYNLWQGFAMTPKPGDCSLYWAHVRDNVCCGNEGLYRYVRAWMANVVQTPVNRPGVALVLRGPQGTGKGVFAKGFGRLFAPHFAHITNSQQLVGRFNALLKKAVVVFADESFWAGDKQAEGTLNALVTEETHNIEQKGIDPISVRNFIHLIIASNHDWVVHASSTARRWLPMDMNEAHLQDHDYFNAIDTQMKNGGSAALLYELLHHQYSDVDLWTVPKTAALDAQKVHSMTPVEKFWFGCLEAGSQIGGRRVWNEGLYASDQGWQTKIRSAALYDAYVARSQQAGVLRKAVEMEMADALKRMVPEAVHKPMRFGLDEVARGWLFPPLADCRKAFDTYMRWTYSWPSNDLNDLRDEAVTPKHSS